MDNLRGSYAVRLHGSPGPGAGMEYYRQLKIAGEDIVEEPVAERLGARVLLRNRWRSKRYSLIGRRFRSGTAKGGKTAEAFGHSLFTGRNKSRIGR